jgi:hypothetical protein
MYQLRSLILNGFDNRWWAMAGVDYTYPPAKIDECVAVGVCNGSIVRAYGRGGNEYTYAISDDVLPPLDE